MTTTSTLGNGMTLTEITAVALVLEGSDLTLREIARKFQVSLYVIKGVNKRLGIRVYNTTNRHEWILGCEKLGCWKGILTDSRWGSQQR